MQRDLDFAQPIYSSLHCPICQEVFYDPVITAACNHSFCRLCMMQVLEMDTHCPLCRSKDTVHYHPNLALASIIQELLVHCPNRKDGCPAVVKLEAIDHHLKECRYFPIHCEYDKYGCDFTGNASDMDDHIKSCVFKKLKPFIEASQEALRHMEAKLQKQQKELERLREFVRTSKTDPSTLNEPLDHSEPASEPVPATIAVIEGWPKGSIHCERTIKEENDIGVTSLSYEGSSLYFGNYRGLIRGYNAETGEKLSEWRAHTSTVWCIAHDTERNRLFSGSSDKTIKLFDLDSLESVSTLTDHKGKIYSLSISGDRLYSCSSDKKIKCFDISSGNQIHCLSTFTGHEDNVNAICWWNSRLVSCSSDKFVKIWDTETQTAILSWNNENSEILDVSQSQNMILASTYDAYIHAIDPRSGETIKSIPAHNWEIWQIDSLDDVLFSGSFDHTLKRWDLRMFQCTATLLGHHGYIHALRVSNQRMISGCADRTVKFWRC